MNCRGFWSVKVVVGDAILWCISIIGLKIKLNHKNISLFHKIAVTLWSFALIYNETKIYTKNKLLNS